MRVLVPGTGAEHPTENDCAHVRFTGWRRDGSLFSNSGTEPAAQCIRQMMPGIREALRAMVAGEQRRVWVPAALTFRAREPGEPIPNVDLTFDLELVVLKRAPPTPSDLTAPPKGAHRMSSGVTMLVLHAGSGPARPTATSRNTVHLSGWTRDGALFENTTTAGHPATVSLGDVVPGLREALLTMTTGEKARLWIPAALAYGERPVRRSLPAGDLVYEVELLAVE